MSTIVEDLRGRARGYRIGGPSASPTAVMLDEAADRIEQLEAALRYALENSGGTQYWGDDDDCGTHSCCGEVSYKPHTNDCWTVKARAAIRDVAVIILLPPQETAHD